MEARREDVCGVQSPRCVLDSSGQSFPATFELESNANERKQPHSTVCVRGFFKDYPKLPPIASFYEWIMSPLLKLDEPIVIGQAEDCDFFVVVRMWSSFWDQENDVILYEDKKTKMLRCTGRYDSRFFEPFYKRDQAGNPVPAPDGSRCWFCCEEFVQLLITRRPIHLPKKILHRVYLVDYQISEILHMCPNFTVATSFNSSNSPPLPLLAALGGAERWNSIRDMDYVLPDFHSWLQRWPKERITKSVTRGTASNMPWFLVFRIVCEHYKSPQDLVFYYDAGLRCVHEETDEARNFFWPMRSPVTGSFSLHYLPMLLGGLPYILPTYKDMNGNTNPAALMFSQYSLLQS